MTDRVLRHHWTARWRVVLAVSVVAALAALAARHITASLGRDGPTAATSLDASGALPLPSLAPPEPGALAPRTWSDPIIGPPVIQPVDLEAAPDRVTLQPGRTLGLATPPPEAAAPHSGRPGVRQDRPDVTTADAARRRSRSGCGSGSPPVATSPPSSSRSVVARTGSRR